LLAPPQYGKVENAVKCGQVNVGFRNRPMVTAFADIDVTWQVIVNRRSILQQAKFGLYR